jgi:ribosomal protein S18 acetylase RimI-like enzyme
MYEYRHVCRDDLGEITRVINSSRRGLPLSRDKTPEEIETDSFGDEDFDAKGTWLVLEDGRAVAYGDGFVDHVRLRIGRSEGFARVEVVPEHRGRGIEEALMAHVFGYLRSRGVKAAQAGCHEPDGWRRALLLGAGFREVRAFYSMVWRGRAAEAPLCVPEGFRFERILMKEATDGQLSLLGEAVSDAMSEHFNFAPVTIERLVKWRDALVDETLITLAWQGDLVVGACLAEDSNEYNRQNGTRDGYIGVLCVRKPYRKRGLGRALLTDAMGWQVGRGLDTVHLGVDGENPKALDLYKSMGYCVHNKNAVYWFDL